MAFNYRGGSSRSQNEKFTWKPDKKIQDTHKDTFSDFGVETSEPWNQSQQKQQDAWEMSSEEYAARQQNQISWTGETNEELKQRSQNSKQTRDGFQRGGWRERKKQQDANERRTFVAGQNYQSVSIDINGPQQPNSYPDEIDSMTQEGVRHIVLNFPNICDINGNIIQMNQDGKRIFGIRTLKIPSLNEVLRTL
ncbi:MAG: hypothetical protein EZS28_011720 [Streblomastix strix]|uniref:Uncharacterized protein n=1 Tax=Streblomastix strix TaxID=222440 RepID=A0A5J4WCW6_9EUKA|nr:MAG: hypothetical protein EZS28_011720 [Streblomastix strix]